MDDGLFKVLFYAAIGAGGVILYQKYEEDKKAKANPEDEIEERLEKRIREMDMRDYERQRMLMERDRY
jgi:hypothetical protein